jgi:hypothetical protein
MIPIWSCAGADGAPTNHRARRRRGGSLPAGAAASKRAIQASSSTILARHSPSPFPTVFRGAAIPRVKSGNRQGGAAFVSIQIRRSRPATGLPSVKSPAARREPESCLPPRSMRRLSSNFSPTASKRFMRAISIGRPVPSFPRAAAALAQFDCRPAPTPNLTSTRLNRRWSKASASTASICFPGRIADGSCAIARLSRIHSI